jgi:hypothetical protein
VLGEVLLEVEDREVIRLRDPQELAKRRIRVDRLLVHEAVALGIVDDARGHIGAGDERTLGEAKEGAELGTDRRGLREDAGLGGRTVHRLGLALPLATRLLDEARRELLNNLEARRRRGKGSLLGRELLVEGVDLGRELGADVILRDSRDIGRRSRSRSSRRRNSRGRNDRGRDGGNNLLGSRLLGGLGGRDSHRGGCNGGNNRLHGGLLRSDLGRLGGGSGRAHYVSGGGSIGGHGTRYAFCVGGAPGVSTLYLGGQKLPSPPRKEPIAIVTNEH